MPPALRRRAVCLFPWALVLGLLAAFSARVHAQAPTPDAARFDGRVGLPQNTAFDVIQDHQAFMWVGTNDGLTRFDGKDFVVFRHRPDDPSSLSHNTVRLLFEDRQHRLWIRTEAGLDRHDRQSGRFQRYQLEAQQLFEDEAGLIVAAHDGLHRLDEVSGRFEKLAAFPLALDLGSPSAADPVWGLRRTRSGVTWIATQQGHLFGWSPGGGTRALRLPGREATLLHEDPGGRLWVGHDAGIALFDPDAARIIPHQPFTAVQGSVIAFGRGQDDEVWFGGTALYRSNGRGTDVTRVDAGDEPLGTPIWSVLVDREGLVWIATPRGLRFHNPYAKRWLHADTSGPGPPLGGDAVMAIARGSGRALWVGTLDGGLDRLTADGRGMVVDPRAAVAGRPADQIWALLPDGRQRLWIGLGRGLRLVDGNSNRKVPLAPQDPMVFTLLEDRHGGIWAGTTLGLFRIDPRTLAVHRMPGVGGGNVEGLFAAADGAVWAGTTRSDVYRIDPLTLETRQFSLGTSAEFRGSEGFWAFAETGDGRLWLGGDRGLFLFDPVTAAVEAFDERRGVPAAPVYAILRDEKGSLWLSTRNGLWRHDNPLAAATDTAIVRHYTTDDGLPFGEFNRRAAAAGPDGWLAFGGMGGIVVFRPAEFRDNPHPPPVHILDVERARRDGPPVTARPINNAVQLAVGDAGFVVRFTAPSFADAHRELLQYRMDGVDPDWVTASSDRLARYPALPPGRHVFRVRAANGDGAWNLAGASLTVLVPAPWWATWWFRAGAGLTGLAAFVAALRWLLTRPLRRRVRALELDQRVRAERERISRDLHDNVGAQVVTMLASIELAGLRAGRGETGPLQHVLSDLREDARRTIAQLRETVWSLRHDHISLRDLAGQVQDDLRNRQRAMATPLLTCDSTGDLSLELGSERALHLFRIVQEAVTNAIRHAGAATVRVTIASDPATGTGVSIHDDGVFRRPPDDHQGSGLAGMRSRADEIGATFDCRGTPHGTTIEVRLPAADGEATRVRGLR